ncbi:unnamed protein product [Lactuca saligna]|uniref:Uncharacterized protein n=1 Tax=Lactuca saligna TaxID=75948 RepID=A0AA36EPC5_LACSI|nr:unnamed protein product [Lactuca saligna]
MDRMFDEFANLWMKMKIQVKTKEDLDSKQYIFRPRAFDIKDVIEMDVSTLESSIANEAFSEWKELASEEVSVESEKQLIRSLVGDDDPIPDVRKPAKRQSGKEGNILVEDIVKLGSRAEDAG